MKETFFCHLLTVGALLVFLYGVYKNNKFLAFLSLNMKHFPSVVKYFTRSNLFEYFNGWVFTPLRLYSFMLQKTVKNTKFPE